MSPTTVPQSKAFIILTISHVKHSNVIWAVLTSGKVAKSLKYIQLIKWKFNAVNFYSSFAQDSHCGVDKKTNAVFVKKKNKKITEI